MPSARPLPTFLERYCRFHHIEEDDFPLHLLGRCLHAPLRWIWPISKSALLDYLEPDIGCVRAAGRLSRRRELEEELTEFNYHPRNRHIWRRILKERLSTRRLRRELRALPEE